MKSLEISLLNKLYKTAEGFRALEKIFISDNVNFNHARQEIIRAHKENVKKKHLEYLKNAYVNNMLDASYHLTPIFDQPWDQISTSVKNMSLLEDPILKENFESELLSHPTLQKVKDIEVIMKKDIVQKEDQLGTLLNICTYLTYKEALEHSFSFVQILNEIKTKDEKLFICQGFEYIDVLVFSALGRCRSWKKISKEAKNQIPLLCNWFEGIKKEHKDVFELYNNSTHNNNRKDQKATIKKKPLRDNNLEFLGAVKKGDVKEADNYLVEGANIECIDLEDRNKTACHIACEKGDLQMLKLLDKYNCNLEALDCEQMTPIFYALASEQIEVIDYLITRGINLEHGDLQLRTPFYWACSRCSLEVVKYLYDKKCNVNAMSKLGRSALSKAAYIGRVEIVDFLLSCPEIQIDQTGEKGRTALHMSVWGKTGGRYGKKIGSAETTDSPEVTNLLLSRGAQVNLKDQDGNVPLNTASASSAEGSIPVLLQFGADVNIANNLGETPLYKASQKGYLGVCKLLFDSGKANPFLKSNSNLDCLQVAIANNHHEVVLFYLNKLDKKLDEDDVYFEDICNRIAKSFKPKEAASLLNELFKIKKISESLIFDKETLKNLVALESEEILNALVPWMKMLYSKKGEESIVDTLKWILDIALKRKWVNCFKFLRTVFDPEISSLKWNVTDLSLDFSAENMSYLLQNFNIDLFNINARKESIIHLLVRQKKTQLLACISKLLTVALQPTHMMDSSQKINNIYIKDLDLTRVVNFLNAKNADGHTASELAVIHKHHDVSTILEQLIGKKLENLFVIPPYQLETSAANINTAHRFKEKLIQLETQLEEEIIKGNNDVDHLLFGNLKEKELEYFKSIHPDKPNVDNQTHPFQKNSYMDLITKRKVVLVEDETTLQQLAEKLLQASVIGVDMECYGVDICFVCLIQISSVDEDYLIDCLKLHKLVGHYLQPVFESNSIVKVFHGCDNDLKWLKSNFDLDVMNLFDTSRAYMILGSDNTSVSLAWLTIKFLGFELNKAYQTSDWRVRPLPQVMIDYARSDSCVLLYLWHILCSELRTKTDSRAMIIQMMQKMTRKCWKAIEDNNLKKISLSLISQ